MLDFDQQNINSYLIFSLFSSRKIYKETGPQLIDFPVRPPGIFILGIKTEEICVNVFIRLRCQLCTFGQECVGIKDF